MLSAEIDNCIPISGINKDRVKKDEAARQRFVTTRNSNHGNPKT
jgi:hypothetical protein